MYSCSDLRILPFSELDYHNDTPLPASDTWATNSWERVKHAGHTKQFMLVSSAACSSQAVFLEPNKWQSWRMWVWLLPLLQAAPAEPGVSGQPGGVEGQELTVISASSSDSWEADWRFSYVAHKGIGYCNFLWGRQECGNVVWSTSIFRCWILNKENIWLKMDGKGNQ